MNSRKSMYKSLWNKYNVMLLVFQITMLVSLIAFCDVYDLYYRSADMIACVSADIISIALLTFMFQSSMQSKLPDKMIIRFMTMTVICTLYVYLDSLGWLINGMADMRWIITTVNTLCYLCSLYLACVFWHLAITVQTPMKYTYTLTKSVGVLTVVDTVLIFLNIPVGFFFNVSEHGYYLRSETYYLSFVIPTFILAISVIHILLNNITLKEKAVLLSYPIVPYIVSLMTNNTSGPTFMCSVTAAMLFFIYTNIYVRKEHELMNKKAELAELKVNSMLLQINPHFIYNTIGTAASLCTEDAEKARGMLYTFSDYLRNNFGDMAHKSMIPFSMELEHLETYIEIEKIRFPDIEVKLDIKATDFMIPSLSVQPLVENAITHGIMGREEGGTLKISSYEDKKWYYVFVEDDGIGFETMEKHDGRNHYGVSNVKNRLSMLCGGQLIIQSTVGIGTIAEIRIPKN